MMDCVGSAYHATTFPFLVVVLEAAEKRRASIEQRASFLLASNTLLLAAVSGTDLSGLLQVEASIWLGLRIMLGIMLLVGVSGSSFFVLHVLYLSPLTPADTFRFRVPQLAVFYHGDVSRFADATAYFDAIDGLTPEQIRQQIAQQIFVLSVVLERRYARMAWAYSLFVLGVLGFLGLLAISVVC